MSEEVAVATGNEIPGEAEQQARVQGWSPKEEWRGDPEKWVDAKTFLEKGEQIHGVTRERNRSMTREIRELKSLILEQKDMAQKARLQGYQQALEDIQKRQREAAATADVDAYDAAERDRAKVVKAYQAEQQVPVSSVDHEFEDWRAENQWFDEDEDMEAYARAISVTIQKDMKLGGRKLYDEVAKRVKKVFPHKFSNPRRNEAAAVEVGAQPPAPKKSGKTFDDLPASAKASYEKLKKVFEQEGTKYPKEEYLANYVWD